jgi:hypothetical protein
LDSQYQAAILDLQPGRIAAREQGDPPMLCSGHAQPEEGTGHDLGAGIEAHLVHEL